MIWKGGRIGLGCLSSEMGDMGCLTHGVCGTCKDVLEIEISISRRVRVCLMSCETMIGEVEIVLFLSFVDSSGMSPDTLGMPWSHMCLPT